VHVSKLCDAKIKLHPSLQMDDIFAKLKPLKSSDKVTDITDTEDAKKKHPSPQSKPKPAMTSAHRFSRASSDSSSCLSDSSESSDEEHNRKRSLPKPASASVPPRTTSKPAVPERTAAAASSAPAAVPLRSSASTSAPSKPSKTATPATQTKKVTSETRGKSPPRPSRDEGHRIQFRDAADDSDVDSLMSPGSDGNQSDISAVSAALAASLAGASYIADTKRRPRIGTVLTIILGAGAVAGTIYLMIKMWKHLSLLRQELEQVRGDIDIASVSPDDVNTIARNQLEVLLAQPAPTAAVPDDVDDMESIDEQIEAELRRAEQASPQQPPAPVASFTNLGREEEELQEQLALQRRAEEVRRQMEDAQAARAQAESLRAEEAQAARAQAESLRAEEELRQAQAAEVLRREQERQVVEEQARAAEALRVDQERQAAEEQSCAAEERQAAEEQLHHEDVLQSDTLPQEAIDTNIEHSEVLPDTKAVKTRAVRKKK
jgi:hypothetical protein